MQIVTGDCQRSERMRQAYCLHRISVNNELACAADGSGKALTQTAKLRSRRDELA